MHPLTSGEPHVIGGYRLLGRLGAGGMGRVYLGRSQGGRTVAVKVVHPHIALDEEFRARFRREVAAARRVGGQWTAPVLDADPEAHLPWVATGFVAGPPLSRAIGDHGPLPESSVRALIAGLAEVLAAVHALGLVHRDVKPSNVLLALDGPRLIDFGIARALDGATVLTSTGVSVGSPGYMSPEQILGQPVGAATDVFALGALLAYAATGKSPFPGNSSATLLYRVIHGTPELDGVGGALRELAEACLAKDPDARPTPAEVAHALAPSGAAGLVRAGWLPWPVVEQVSRLAVDLLDREPPPLPSRERPRAPLEELEPPRARGPVADRPSSLVGPGRPRNAEPAEARCALGLVEERAGERATGARVPPQPRSPEAPVARAAPAGPVTDGPVTDGRPVAAGSGAREDAREPGGAPSTGGAPSDRKPKRRRRGASCALSLTVGAAVLAGAVFGARMFFPASGGSSLAPGPVERSEVATPSDGGLAVPVAFLGSWKPPVAPGEPVGGTFVLRLHPRDKRGEVGSLRRFDLLGRMVCEDSLRLLRVTPAELAAEAVPRSPATGCAIQSYRVHLLVSRGSLGYSDTFWSPASHGVVLGRATP
ncbi:protein kinase [Streptomyces sp. NPDC057638]|uniref:serine/threonine-protein kinase n=1 Tax=Streptomyces sp. NPDC057638 TaxID=3346190 RepID=UPI00369F7266